MNARLASPLQPLQTVAPPSWTVVAAIAAAGAVGVTVLVSMAFTDGIASNPTQIAALAAWITVPYIAAGLVAWRRRPESRLGILMVIGGFVGLASFLSLSNNDVAFTLGIASDFLPIVVFLHVAVAFPGGRLDGRVERTLVAAAYVTAGLSVARLLLGAEAARNVLSIVDRPAQATWLLGFQRFTLAVLMVTAAGVLLVRRRRQGRPLRATFGILVNSFSVSLLLLGLLLLSGVLDLPIAGPIQLLSFAVLGLAPVAFLVGLLQARLAREAVAALVVELGVNLGPAELRDAIARALRDPSVTIAFWLPEFDSYADGDGHAVELSVGPERALTPIERDGRPVAVLVHDAALEDEPELVSSVAAAVGMAIENARLQVELRARIEEVRGSRARILEAGQQERRRLERDLHDGAQQRLVALSLKLSNIAQQAGDDAELVGAVRSAADEVATILAELRDLAAGIHPAIVTDHGLMVALESLATRAPIPVDVEGATVPRLPEAVEIAAFFLVSESLANIGKHARATHAVITLARQEGLLTIEVRDDGVGGATADGVGSGLRGLADRVEALGGTVEVLSPPGAGTRVRAEIPCAP